MSDNTDRRSLAVSYSRVAVLAAILAAGIYTALLLSGALSGDTFAGSLSEVSGDSVDASGTGLPFEVSKDFQPDNAASVTVSLSCTSGTVSPPSATVSEASPAVFSVGGFSGDPLCTATETPIPDGYVSTGTCSGNLLSSQRLPAGIQAPAGFQGFCTIVNVLNNTSLIVLKDFTDDNQMSVSVDVVCTSGTLSPSSPQPASESAPANFGLTGFTAGATTCSATENPVPAGYVQDDSDCQNVTMELNGEHDCTIVNTPPTPTPSPTPTASPTPSLVPETPSPTPTPTLSPTPPATASPTLSATPTLTPTPTLTATPTPTLTPTPTPTVPPVTAAPATAAPSLTPGALPPTGGATAGADPTLLWVLVLALGCLVAGSTSVVLARARR